TPGAPNAGGTTSVTALTINLITPSTSWRWDNSGGTNLPATWNTNTFVDSAWSTGLPLFGTESTPSEYLPYTFQTSIPPPTSASGHITTYYRTYFSWNGSLSNFTLFATNYIDDGVA